MTEHSAARVFRVNGYKWHCHPDPQIDLAVTPLAGIVNDELQGQHIFWRQLNDDGIPPQEKIATFDASEEVCFVGYPNSVMDDKNLTPIIRRGYTASPYELDFSGKPEFLIDAAVFPGSSGSPVFRVSGGKNKGFLGVISQCLLINNKGNVQSDVPSDRNWFMNLGVVIKAQEVVKLVDDYIKKYKDRL